VPQEQEGTHGAAENLDGGDCFAQHEYW